MACDSETQHLHKWISPLNIMFAGLSSVPAEKRLNLSHRHCRIFSDSLSPGGMKISAGRRMFRRAAQR